MEQGIVKVPLDMIDRDPFQPRTEFDNEELQRLVLSIKENGLLQPISLKRNGGGRFIIIAGERRFRSAQILGWSDIPAIIHDIDKEVYRKMQLLENCVRVDLNPVELALAINRMLDEKIDADQIARSIGKDKSYIAWITSILNCNERALHMLANKQLPVWVGWHMARLSANGQNRALRTFQLNSFNANEMVTICEKIYSEENQVEMFDPASLTSGESIIMQSLEQAYNRLFHMLERALKLDKAKPGVAGTAKIPRGSIKIMKNMLYWLDKQITSREVNVQ
jgi:ParB/RepB/Spo0J family partition protein